MKLHNNVIHFFDLYIMALQPLPEKKAKELCQTLGNFLRDAAGKLNQLFPKQQTKQM